VFAALALGVPHANAVTDAECTGRYDNTSIPGTVTDKDTGLTWEKTAFPAWPGGYHWDQAQMHCQNLALGTYSDWRLPDVIELQTLYDESVLAPPGVPLDKVFNDLDQQGVYWTSTLDATYAGYAWTVNFGDPMSNAAVLLGQGL